jgi:gliding motility-associated-like protein
MCKKNKLSPFILGVFLWIIGFSSKAQAQNIEAPIVQAQGSEFYCPLTEQNIVSSFSISSSTNSDIEAFYIQISSGYARFQDRLLLLGDHPTINANWNANEAKLSLLPTTGNSISFSDLTAAIYDVKFYSSNPNVTTNKVFSLTAGGANYLPSTQHYYKYVSQINISWTEAKAAAENQQYYGLQGYLTTILTDEEANLVGNLSPGIGWIGGSDQVTEGVWKWVTGPEAGTIFWNGDASGSSPNYAKWNNGEPNNAGDEDYAHITDDSVGIPGSWNDLPNISQSSGPYQAKGYLVEFGGMPGDPELNISASTELLMAKVIQAPDRNTCENQSVTLTATTTSGNAYWFDAATGGNLVHTGLNFTPRDLNRISYWVQAQANNCESFARTQVEITYYPLPVIDTNTITIEQCDDDEDSDGYTLFNLRSNEPLISRNYETELFEYYKENNALITQPESFQNESFDQIIKVKVISPQGCSSYSAIRLKIGASEIDEDFMIKLQKCETVTKTTLDGLEHWSREDLSAIQVNLINADPKFTEQNITISLYKSKLDALTNSNPIDLEAENFSFYMSTPYQQEIWAYITSIDLDKVNCIGLKQIATLNVIPPPGIEVIEEEDVYCLDQDPIIIGILSEDHPNYSYSWSLNGNPFPFNIEGEEKRVFASQPGEYIVTATSNDGYSCSISKRIQVISSKIANLSPSDLKVKQLNDDENSIEILTVNLGIGDYEFALNDPMGSYQDSPKFNNLSPGDYQLHIRDKNGCGIYTQDVSILGYDRFFSPNGDGINDTWRIKGALGNFQDDGKIYIYDRYGKLLKILDPFGPGWDGRFKGIRLPEDSYWFQFQTIEGQNVSGYFSLIR